MKTGDLAEVIVPIPSVFETLDQESNKMIKTGDLVLLIKHIPTGWLIPSWQVVFDGQLGIIPSRWIRPVFTQRTIYLDEEEQDMPLNSQELIELVPDVHTLVKTLTKALRKDADGKVRVTKDEAKRIRDLAAKLVLQLAKDVVD
jgi:hypothetical protein